MAFAVADRVKETSTTTGTGTISLAGVVVGFQTFVSAIGNGNTTYYGIFAPASGEFEVGVGTVTDASPDTLSRDTVLQSSNSDNLVNFSAGNKVAFVTQPAEKAVYLAPDGSISADFLATLTGTQALTNKTLASPTINGASMTGTVTAPTQAAGTSNTTVATTSFASTAADNAAVALAIALG
tara:strand:- start:606 stop:1151 length:546 start_codon:yes stop_codon:yes gene_type:complete